jgi:hypothetical protein
LPLEDNNQLVHARSMPVADGVVLSLTALPDLPPTREESLRRIGLHRVSDLLHFRTVHDAQLISALALAEQHMTDRREQASHALGPGIGPPIRRRPSRAPRWE